MTLMPHYSFHMLHNVPGLFHDAELPFEPWHMMPVDVTCFTFPLHQSSHPLAEDLLSTFTYSLGRSAIAHTLLFQLRVTASFFPKPRVSGIDPAIVVYKSFRERGLVGNVLQLRI